METPRQVKRPQTFRVSPSIKLAVFLSGLLPVIWSLSNNAGPTFPESAENNLILPPLTNNDYSSKKQISLRELTNAQNNHAQEKAECEEKSFVYVQDVIQSESSSRLSSRRIPKIIHQTSKSRCMTKMFAQVTSGWRSLEGYDYYLHDDQAMIRLLSTSFEEFPMLQDLMMANCLPHGTLKADVWRYLVLWEYGGIYADIDTRPTPLFNTTIPILQDSDDGWFMVEQFHILSQYVMAVSPRHPLMYFAVHRAINNIVAQADTNRINAALITGPHALHRAFQEFSEDAGVHVDPQGVGYKPVWAGVWKGTDDRSITVVGRGEFEGEFVTREMMSLPLKKKQYAKMNMTSFHDDKLKASGHSCLSALFQYHKHKHEHNRLKNEGMAP